MRLRGSYDWTGVDRRHTKVMSGLDSCSCCQFATVSCALRTHTVIHHLVASPEPHSVCSLPEATEMRQERSAKLSAWRPSGSGVCSRSSTVSACAVRPPMAPRRSQLRAAARRWRHRVRECPTGRRSGAVPSYVGGASHVNGEHSIAARLARGDFAFLTSNLRTWREKDRQSRAQNPRRPR